MIDISCIKYIIFDMDGVLLLSLPVHVKSFKEVLRKINVHDFDYSRYAGMCTDECFKAVLREKGISFSPKKLEELVREKKALSNRYFQQSLPLHPNAPEVIKKLSGRFTLALATSASEANMNLFLSQSGCAEFFSCIINGKNVKHAKPAPDIYLKVAESLSFPTAQALVVEDSINGIKAATSAGMHCVGIRGLNPEQEMLERGAIKVLSSIAELPLLLEVV